MLTRRLLLPFRLSCLPSCRVRRAFAGAATLFTVAACGDLPQAPVAVPIVASQVAQLVGVPDRGLDPSAVMLTNARGEDCSGVLLASDVVLTSRHCVGKDAAPFDCAASGEPAPPTDNPATIHVYTDVPGPSVPWVSAGIAVFTSNDPVLCGADIAVVILEWPIAGALPGLVSESGIAEGSFVRTVSLGSSTALGPSAVEIVREHVPVLQVAPTELALEEATCVGSPGGPAYDETTGEIVGILSRWGSVCGSATQFDVFTRVDAFYPLIEEALAWGPSLSTATLDAGASAALLTDAGRKRDAGRAKKPPTDIGAACQTGSDCGTGVCVTDEGSQFCSRSCAVADNCPTDFKCVADSAGGSVCVHS
jgi:hypothetical protein